MSDPHVLGPDLAPTPFTADEIRAGCADGHRLLVRTQLGGRHTFHTDTFGAGDIGYGLLASLWGGGMILGSALTAVLGGHRSFDRFD